LTQAIQAVVDNAVFMAVSWSKLWRSCLVISAP